MSRRSSQSLRIGLRRGHALWVGLVLVAALLWLAPAASAEIYRYVDNAGVTHYSDSIHAVPLQYQNQLVELNDLDQAGGFVTMPSEGTGADEAWEEDEDYAGFDELGGMDEGQAQEMGEAIAEKLGAGVILIVLLLLPVLYLLGAGIMMLACKLGGGDPVPSLWRACGVIFVQGLGNMAVGGVTTGVGMALGIDETASVANSLALNGASMVLTFLVSAGVLTAMLGYGYGRSLLIGVVHTLLVLVLVFVPIAGIGALVFFSG